MGMTRKIDPNFIIARTIRSQDRGGDITEDETVRFKAYLMSMGIDDPVTRDAYKSSNEYFRQLAMQLSQILEEPIKVCGQFCCRYHSDTSSLIYQS